MGNLIQKPISELLDKQFFIPSYQRGFRWEQQQVIDLLNDIWDFTKKEKENKEFYCLQPIVIKECNEETKKRNELTGTWYEVIDGQQRLTTLHILLTYFNPLLAVLKKKKYTLNFETRSDSVSFLSNIKLELKEDNIDYFFIYEAFDAITKWFEANPTVNQLDFLNTIIREDDEEGNGNKNVRVIWYEVPAEKDSVEIFTRINMGKIPLTNAELIKALFLNSSNFKKERVKAKQFEIATDWDRIEYSLQNDEFWYFINKAENILPTRIEFIFNLIEDIAKGKNNNDQYSTYRFFNAKFNSRKSIEKNVGEIWKEIKNYFQTLEEWFLNRELYHKVGYLVAIGMDLKDLIEKAKGKAKLEFVNYLNVTIQNELNNYKIEELKYGNGLIKNILLYHNIQTMLDNENETSRFPFDRYKKESWDIEHIHAIATEMPTIKQHRIDWLNNAKEFTDGALQIEINEYLSTIDEQLKADSFSIISDKILTYFAEKTENGQKHEDVDDISNLVLLDSGTNRSYKNAVFPAKRKTIIDKEKTGTFIPICTKNVFLKYYSKDISKMTIWGVKDRNDYLENIKTTLSAS